ncbi:hypothetical protein DFE_3087 [Desulfovibrio ferrophilus]|uniref:Uncharacterized protein n=1 Tax=Desulfovibrio ferrophilus TaxID=241368 RepID=A0A2Z6B2X5_9BACT|nr:hypothetical protein DFE_3087 [Desulfovibrio ferrophilus]
MRRDGRAPFNMGRLRRRVPSISMGDGEQAGYGWSKMACMSDRGDIAFARGCALACNNRF